jgi:hypothetical protein
MPSKQPASCDELFRDVCTVLGLTPPIVERVATIAACRVMLAAGAVQPLAVARLLDHARKLDESERIEFFVEQLQQLASQVKPVALLNAKAGDFVRLDKHWAHHGVKRAVYEASVN